MNTDNVNLDRIKWLAEEICHELDLPEYRRTIHRVFLVFCYVAGYEVENSQYDYEGEVRNEPCVRVNSAKETHEIIRNINIPIFVKPLGPNNGYSIFASIKDDPFNNR